jgi:CheY-like chemotaxis protein
MSQPHLLLVDDSDAILNFEKAVLSGLYRLSSAGNGVEALEKIKGLKPDCVLLDLSMPEMDGDEVLKIIKSDPAYSRVPFLIISSEKDRAENCLKLGAEGILNKPIVADELKVRVALILEEAAERDRKRKTAFLFFQVGAREMGMALADVLSVHSQPATRFLASSFIYLSQEVDYYGDPVKVLDLAGALGIEHSRPLEDRKLIFIGNGEKLAFGVDRVWDPEELPLEQVKPVEAESGNGPSIFESIVGNGRGTVPILKAGFFFPLEMLPQKGLSLRQGEMALAREVKRG